MKKLLGLLLFPGLLLAQDGVNLLIGNQKDLIQTPIVTQQKQLVLDDHFLVQFYGSYMAARVIDQDFNNWAHLVLDKKFKLALETLASLKIDSAAKREITAATKLYLLYKLDLNQSFINEWLVQSVTNNFLNTPFGVALDQIVGHQATQWILTNNIYLTPMQKNALAKLREHNSRFNISLQALFNLRQGEKALDLIGKLPVADPLRIKLADSAILAYARLGELAKSAKLLKEIYEPVLANESDINKISAYYLKLARMLYQAKAFDAANYYYELIPDEADQFLKARVEKMWISMQKNDLAQVRGDMHTLSQQIFRDKFIPEIYLVSSMANLKLCQFSEVEKNFNEFISVNKHFLKEIEENLSGDNPKKMAESDFFVSYLEGAQKNLNKENDILVKKFHKLPQAKELMLRNSDLRDLAALEHKKELKRRWKNREILLESTIRKMRFVKVEFLSTMRRLKDQLAQIQYQDKVQIKSSALDKSGSLSFPYDGVVFGDELFHYTTDLQNLCLRGRK